MSDVNQEAIDALNSVDSSDPVGTETEATVGGSEDQAVGDQGEVFFEWEHPTTKEKLAFRNKGELADHLRHSSMRKQELEAERRKIADRAKYFDEQTRKYELKERELLSKYDQITKMDKFLREHPDVAESIANAMSNRPKQDNSELKRLLEAELTPLKKELEETRAERQKRLEAERKQQVYSQLKSKYDDFDERQLEQYIEQLDQVPEQEKDLMLHELVYHALKGRNSIGELERKMSQQPAKKPNVVSTPGKQINKKDVASMSRKDMDRYAVEILESME